MAHEWQKDGTAARETLLPIGAQVINARVDPDQTEINQGNLTAHLTAHSGSASDGTEPTFLIYKPNQSTQRRIGTDDAEDVTARSDCINDGELAFRLKDGMDKRRGRQTDHVLVFSNLAGLASPYSEATHPGVWEELQQEWLHDHLQYVGLAITPDSHADQQGKLNLHLSGPITQRNFDKRNVIIGKMMSIYFPKNSELKEMHANASNQTGERPVAILRAEDPAEMDILSFAYFSLAANEILDIADKWRVAIGHAVNKSQREAAYQAADNAFKLACAKKSFTKLVFNHFVALLTFVHTNQVDKDAVKADLDKTKRKGGYWRYLLLLNDTASLRTTYTTREFFIASHGALLSSLRAFVSRQMERHVGVALNNARPKARYEMQTRPFAW